MVLGVASMDFVDCRLVINIARSESLTQGARNTYLSLPAASLRLKALEEELGLRLFHRTRNGMVLTVAGQCLLEHAHAIVDRLNALHVGLQEFKDRDRCFLRVAANTSYITDLLPDVVREYLSLHPEVSIDVQTGRTDEVESRIMDGRADIGFISCPRDTFSVEPIDLGPDPLVMIVSADSALGELPTIDVRHFAQCDHVVLGDDSTLTRYLRERLAEQGLHLRVRVGVASYRTMYEMVAANIGVGMIHQSLARRYDHPNVRCVKIQADWSQHRRYALLSEEARNLHYVNDFLGYVTEACAWPLRVGET